MYAMTFFDSIRKKDRKLLKNERIYLKEIHLEIVLYIPT